ETIADVALPPVPLTVEGASVLHQMMRFRWPAWRALSPGARVEVLDEPAKTLAGMGTFAGGRQTGVASMRGHKGALPLVHFPRNLEELTQAEVALARLRLRDYVEPVHSYVSIIELGLYESTSKVYGDLAARGVEIHSDEWKQQIESVLDRQRQA